MFGSSLLASVYPIPHSPMLYQAHFNHCLSTIPDAIDFDIQLELNLDQIQENFDVPEHSSLQWTEHIYQASCNFPPGIVHYADP